MSIQTLPDAARLRAALAAGRLPDERGRFGPFGGRYVPETLIPALERLERGVREHLHAQDFQHELAQQLKTWVGRPTALTFAARLSARWGAKVWLKREDLAHTGAHKINNATGQALLAKRLGARRIVAETGAGQHGVASAAACARLGLPCTVYMGEIDMQRQAPNVGRMRLLGTKVVPVTSGDRTLRAAIDEALRDWVADPLDTYYLLGSAVGPHPYPYLVRELQAVIGREARDQIQEAEGRLPDACVACVGGGSNAMGLFYAFLPDKSVRLFGVEAAGDGLETPRHAATLLKGRVGVLHGARSYVLCDDDGQIAEAHSISAGLDYPGVGPEHAHLKETGRARYLSITDDEALGGFQQLARTEGILPALETSHAIAALGKVARELEDGAVIVVCISGRGDKDMGTIAKRLGVTL